MKKLIALYQSFWLNKRFYQIIVGICGLFILGFFFHPIIPFVQLLLVALAILVLLDAIALYSKREGISAKRTTTDRYSNGDENGVKIFIANHFSFNIDFTIIDELPIQFQERKLTFKSTLNGNTQTNLNYALTPLQRGEFVFGLINVFINSPLGLVQRRLKLGEPQTVITYPSFQRLKKYQMMASASQLNESGVKRMRKLGNSMEFEQIKEYVIGDDYRNINWKATARKGSFMVNNYTDEKSQYIYCIIDKGRNMKMPFKGMTLLDYAINASLVISNIVLLKNDKAGLITFSKKQDDFVPAERKGLQMERLLEALYRQQTLFTESDFEALYAAVRNNIKQRATLVLYTNFQSLHSFQRQLPFLRKIARHHLLLVVFFEDTALRELREKSAETMEEIYTKTIADKFAFEKRLMVKELQQHGILTLLTTPENLTVEAINKYIELKSRQAN